jgi:class 3 adenylate cyclase
MKDSTLHKVELLSDSIESLSRTFDLYILFIDLCDSTRIKQFCLENQIPDSVWIIRQMIFLSRTSTIIQSYGGQVIKTIGDEVMSVFDITKDPPQILKCCFDVFQSFHNLKGYNKGTFIINAKAAIDYGTCYDGHLFGTSSIDPIGSCVDRCARISKHAGKSQIVFSDDFKSVLDEKAVDLTPYKIETLNEEFKGLGQVLFHRLTT